MDLLFFIISFLASVLGAICGNGGGVIIKPILDASGIMSVSTVSFLSACTVLSMSVVSVIKSFFYKTVKLNFKISTLLATGAAFGGIIGKYIFNILKTTYGNENLLGLIQAVILIIVTTLTLAYTIFKNKIKTYQITNFYICIIVGIVLGMMSGFLGIGGGPINLMVLGFLFSMKTKEAAINSIYIIMFSQTASFIQTLTSNNVPEYSQTILITMISGGILGALVGSKVNSKIDNRKVDKLFMLLIVFIILINISNAVIFVSNN